MKNRLLHECHCICVVELYPHFFTSELLPLFPYTWATESHRGSGFCYATSPRSFATASEVVTNSDQLLLTYVRIYEVEVSLCTCVYQTDSMDHASYSIYRYTVYLRHLRQHVGA